MEAYGGAPSAPSHSVGKELMPRAGTKSLPNRMVRSELQLVSPSPIIEDRRPAYLKVKTCRVGLETCAKECAGSSLLIRRVGRLIRRQVAHGNNQPRLFCLL